MARGERKQARFKRIATKRVTNAIRKIELIGSLSGYSYESTEEEVEKIFSALQETLDNTKAMFLTKKVKPKGFEL